MSQRHLHPTGCRPQETNQRNSFPTNAKRHGSPLSLSLWIIFLCATFSVAQDHVPVEMETPILPASRTPAYQGLGSQVVPANYSPLGGIEVGCAGCDGAGCDSCGVASCGMGGYSGIGLWFRADYMLWWEKDSFLPPLVTTGPDTVPRDDLAVLGIGGTQTLFGNTKYDDNTLDGYRFELGSWIDPSYNIGVFGRYFSTGDRDVSFSAGPNDFDVLGIPFFNLSENDEDSFLLTVPGERGGNVNVNYSGESSGWEILMRHCAKSGNNYRIDYLIGYRRFDLDQSLQINGNTTVVPGSQIGIEGQTILLNDVIATENQFNGVDLGITGHSHEGCWSLDFLAKIALGQMDQDININGSAVVQTPGLADTTLVGGLFSQESNIGQHKSDDFAVIPELNVNVGYAITSQLDFTVGYTLIYVTDVINPGVAMDRVVDEGLIGDLAPFSGNRPLFNQETRDYVLQGLNFGLTGRF